MDEADDLRRAFLGQDKPRLSRRASRAASPAPAPMPAASHTAPRTVVAAPVRTPSGPRQRRIDRARRQLRRAYSPLRILMLLAMSPVVAMGMATSIYISTSPFEPPEALAHVVAMGGCDAAAIVGLVPARPGAPGYHTALDPDGDGQTCLEGDGAVVAAEAAMPGEAAGTRQSGGAKFLRVGQ